MKLLSRILLGSVACCALVATSQAADVTYTYDALGRLSGVAYSCSASTTYAYDAAGNRTSVVNTTATGCPPNAANDAISTPTGSPITFDPRTNDSDPNGYALTITTNTTPSHGSVIINSGTSLKYTPAAGYSGSDSFTYTISNGHGGTDTATVSVTVTGANGAPTAVNDSATTSLNTATTFDPRTNDTDPDGDTLTITAKGTPSHGAAVINSGVSITYTPTTGYTGSDSFTYTISDGHSHTANATISMAVTTANSPPVAVNDATPVMHNTPFTGNPLLNDSDPDGDTLTIISVTTPSHGSVVINAGTTLTYTPVTGYTGQDSFQYTISDGHGHTASATVTLLVI